MRKYIYTILCGALAITLFSACGGGTSSSTSTSSSSSSNELFGNASGVVAEYIQKQADFQKEAEKKVAKMKDIEEGVKLQKELDALEDEAKSKIDAAAKELVGKKIPYEESDGLFFKITSEPVVTKAFANGSKAVSMDIVYRAAQKEAMEIDKLAYTDYPICYKLVDANGTPLWAGMTYIVTGNTKPVKFEAGQDYGQDFNINLSISEKSVDKMKDAAKLIFISKTECEEVQKQLKK